MRLARIVNSSRDYVRDFYLRNPGLAQLPYSEQKRLYDYDHFVWGDGLKRALSQIGHEIVEVDVGMVPMLKAWVRENCLGAGPDTPERAVVQKVSRFNPDIVMFDCSNVPLLLELKSVLSRARLFFGWEGSALGLGRGWPHLDLVLSCAPETVDRLRFLGYRSEHLNHAFDPEINTRLNLTSEIHEISFIGSITRRDSYHIERERCLTLMAARFPLAIYTPSRRASARDYAKAAACGGFYLATNGLRRLGLLDALRKRFPSISNLERLASRPRLPVSRQLSASARPAVYGLPYYQVLKDSLISLNIHADSSPLYASNIRLFEATGAGSCLLTDWRPNLSSLFELDTEVVAYKSPEDCVERADWLMRHPDYIQEVRRRGQARVVREHTFDHRAPVLMEIVYRYLRDLN